MKDLIHSLKFYVLESHNWILNIDVLIKLTRGLKRLYREENRCLTGQNWGKIIVKKNEIIFYSRPRTIILFFVNYDKILKVSINSLEESVSLEFKQQNVVGMKLKELIILIPNNKRDREMAMFEILSKQIDKKSSLLKTKRKIICILHFLQFRIPRGKFTILFFDRQLLLKSQDYKILIEFKQLKKSFILEQPNGKHVIIIALKAPIRQGKTEYNFIICEFLGEIRKNLQINCKKKKIKTKYADLSNDVILFEQISNPMINIFISLFTSIAKIKIISHDKSAYMSKNDHFCFRCSMRGNIGHLFPLTKSFFFIYKPIMHVRFSEIKHVRFEKNEKLNNEEKFDLIINTLNGVDLIFSKIDKKELDLLVSYVSKKKLNHFDNRKRNNYNLSF